MFQIFLKENKFRKYIILFFLLLISVIIIFSSKKEPLHLSAKFGFSPTNKLTNILTDIKNYFNLRKLNEELKEENIFLLKENKELREAGLENTRLREMLKLARKNDLNLLSADVIGKDPTNFFNTLMLNKGFEDGVRENMPVINNSGIIGKIYSTGKNSSKAILLTDSNCSISALDSRSRVYCAVSGTGYSICVMKFVSSDDDVKVGDTIISSGDGEIFPKGLLIGRVIKVEKSRDELMLDIFVKPAVNLKIIEEVFVVIK